MKQRNIFNTAKSQTRSFAYSHNPFNTPSSRIGLKTSYGTRNSYKSDYFETIFFAGGKPKNSWKQIVSNSLEYSPQIKSKTRYAKLTLFEDYKDLNYSRAKTQVGSKRNRRKFLEFDSQPQAVKYKNNYSTDFFSMSAKKREAAKFPICQLMFLEKQAPLYLCKKPHVKDQNKSISYDSTLKLTENCYKSETKLIKRIKNKSKSISQGNFDPRISLDYLEKTNIAMKKNKKKPVIINKQTIEKMKMCNDNYCPITVQNYSNNIKNLQEPKINRALHNKTVEISYKARLRPYRRNIEFNQMRLIRKQNLLKHSFI